MTLLMFTVPLAALSIPASAASPPVLAVCNVSSVYALRTLLFTLSPCVAIKREKSSARAAYWPRLMQFVIPRRQLVLNAWIKTSVLIVAAPFLAMKRCLACTLACHSVSVVFKESARWHAA